MSKTTNYILELESSGEVYFNEEEKSYVTRDRRRHPNADQIHGEGEASRDSLGEARGRTVSVYHLRRQRTSNQEAVSTEAGFLPTVAELPKVLQGGKGN